MLEVVPFGDIIFQRFCRLTVERLRTVSLSNSRGSRAGVESVEVLTINLCEGSSAAAALSVSRWPPGGTHIERGRGRARVFETPSVKNARNVGTATGPRVVVPVCGGTRNPH